MELANMQAARARDVKCRFPLCACHPWLHPARPLPDRIYEVSHQEHRGMGGNPAGDRTLPAGLLLLCRWRHRLSRFSIDRGTVRWVGMTPAGADGPIAWQIKVSAVREVMAIESEAEWLMIAEEVAPHLTQPVSDHAPILQMLAEMKD